MPISMGTIWLILLGVLALVEMATAGLVSIWFCFGALGAKIAEALGASITVQVIVFFVVSVLMLLLTRPLVLKYVKPKMVPTNADRIIGTTGVVLQTVDNEHESGLVRVGGQSWTARSVNSSVIPEGERVIVRAIEGVKAMVEKA